MISLTKNVDIPKSQQFIKIVFEGNKSIPATKEWFDSYDACDGFTITKPFLLPSYFPISSKSCALDDIFKDIGLIF